MSSLSSRNLAAAAPRRSRGATPMSLLLRLAFWGGAALLAWALCRRSITLGDEGHVLSQAADIVAGKVPYRDFDLFVTPGLWYLNAAIFRLAGPSVLATRLAAGLCLLATMAVTKRIVEEAGGPGVGAASDRAQAPAPAQAWGYLGAGLIGVFAVWAFPAWTISFYSPYATLASMGALACLLTAMRQRRGSRYLACGLCLGLAVAFKQNYGALTALGCGLGLLVDAASTARTGSARTATAALLGASLRIAAGAGAVVVPLLVALALQGALPAAVDSIVVRPFHGFLDAHTVAYLQFGDLWRRQQIWTVGGLVYMAVPMMRAAVLEGWPRLAIFAVQNLHFALYWIPWFAFAALAPAAALRLVRGRARAGGADTALTTTALFAAAFFLGVFPRCDFNHLINVYQPVLALLVAVAARCFADGRWRTSRLRGGAAVAAALAALCYTGVAAAWLVELCRSMAFPIQSPRAGVLVDADDARMLDHEIALLHSLTAPNEAVFALPGLSMVPFLADRPMPSRYYNYQSVQIADDGGADAADEIERSGARVVLAHTYNFFTDSTGMLTYAPKLADYVTRHFQPSLTIAGRTHQVLLRRHAPVTATQRAWLWPHCEIPAKDPGDPYLREELLAQTLYHSFSRHAAMIPATIPDGLSNEMTTRCTLTVAPGTKLRIAADLRQTRPAASASSATAELWLLADAQPPKRLLSQQWTLATRPVLSRKAGDERELDLSDYAGKTVTLELRSRLDGALPPGPADFDGLAITWNGARLEIP